MRLVKDSSSDREDTSCSDRCHVNLMPVLWIFPHWLLFAVTTTGSLVMEGTWKG